MSEAYTELSRFKGAMLQRAITEMKDNEVLKNHWFSLHDLDDRGFLGEKRHRCQNFLPFK